MSVASQTGLWAVALAGSLVLHGACAMALMALPTPTREASEPTEISLQTLPTRTTQAISPAAGLSPVAEDNVAAVAGPEAAPVAPVEAPAAATADEVAAEATPLAETVEAPKTVEAATLQPAQPDTTALSAADDLASIEPAATDATVAADSAAVNDVASEPTVAAVVPPPPLVVAVEDETPAVEAARADNPVEPLTDATAPAIVVTDEAVATAPPPETSLVAAARPSPLVEQVQDRTVAAEPAHPGETLEPQSPSVAAPAAVEASNPVAVASPRETAAVVAPAGPAMVARPATTPPASPVTVAPPAGAVATAERAAIAVAAPAAISPSSPVVVAPSSGAAIVEAVPDAPRSEEQVAMLVPNPLSPAAADPAEARKRLATFLKGYPGGDCLLAVPTDADAMEGFSNSPDAVIALGNIYEREAGIPVAATTRTVTSAQCGTLSFLRDVAQYPNFPLQIKLDAGAIASGKALSGKVSGVRKNTVYLFVVDDEGSVKLVQKSSGVTRTSVDFEQPLSLTKGPVSSVQLLLAIASDEPLKTVVGESGLQAGSFFTQLAGEIRGGKRVHYGITSFVVR